MSLASRLLLTTAVVAGFGLFASSPVRAQKGEPAPSKCDKLKKGSAEWKKCTGSLRDDASDQELYYAGYWLARTGRYAEALQFLNRAAVKDERILTYIGFATRKLGDHETAMGLYAQALARNPNYTVARAYMGEALLDKGAIGDARQQLSEIATRCGTACVEYKELAAEFAKRGLAS